MKCSQSDDPEMKHKDIPLVIYHSTNLVNLNGGNVNKCQLLPSVSGLVVSTLTFILGKSLFGLSHLSSVDTASNQIGKVS